MLEVCVTNLASCIAAEQGGAMRLELCNQLSEGGVTPDFNLVKEVKKNVKIDLFILVRCRDGNFVYSNEEVDLMIESIHQLKTLNVDGVVLGCLNEDGTIDKVNCKKMITASRPMKVTFHRAFDEVKNPLIALEEIINLGCERLLTSGQQESAFEGRDLISALISSAKGRITVMPGAGINENNVIEIGRVTGAKEFHASLKRKNTSNLDNEIIEAIRVSETVSQIKKLNES